MLIRIDGIVINRTCVERVSRHGYIYWDDGKMERERGGEEEDGEEVSRCWPYYQRRYRFSIV